MNIFILNPQFVRIGVIDNYESLIWTTKYHNTGDFELYMPADQAVFGLLAAGNYVMRETDTEELMLIETIRINTDEETGDHVTVSGRSSEALMARRIVWEQTNLSGDLAACAGQLVTQNMINPANSSRRVPGVSLGESSIDTISIKRQITGDNLLDAEADLLGTYRKGFRFRFDGSGLKFDIYQGTDRSAAQSAVPRVVFSSDYDNIVTSEYLYDTQAYASVAVVAGEGEGTSRKRQVVGSGTGLNRFELYVDARDISSVTSSGTLTDSQYADLLTARGEQALAEAQTVEAFSGTVEAQYSYVYGEDYFLGDIVQIINDYGASSVVRITAVTQAWDESGYTVIPTFDSEEV